MIVIFAYNIQRAIRIMPTNTTVNSASYYKNFLQENLCLALKKKRQSLLHDDFLILHNNATHHKARTVETLLEEYQWETFILSIRPNSALVTPICSKVLNADACNTFSIFLTTSSLLTTAIRAY